MWQNQPECFVFLIGLNKGTISFADHIHSKFLEPMPSDKPDTPAIQALRESLNKTFRISIQDGRTFTGTFICTDKTKNIILDQTTESKPTAGDQGPRFERDVGMVMIPWKYVTSAEIEKEDRRSWRERIGDGGGAGLFF